MLLPFFSLTTGAGSSPSTAYSCDILQAFPPRSWRPSSLPKRSDKRSERRLAYEFQKSTLASFLD